MSYDTIRDCHRKLCHCGDNKYLPILQYFIGVVRGFKRQSKGKNQKFYMFLDQENICFY